MCIYLAWNPKTLQRLLKHLLINFIWFAYFPSEIQSHAFGAKYSLFLCHFKALKEFCIMNTEGIASRS
jgi:hypothetical protein